jgi:hypothetical protein
MRMERLWAVVGAAALVAGLAGHALAQTATFKQCGQRNSSGVFVPNKTCPGCVVNCQTSLAQTYKVCDVAGNACANTAAVSCSGNLKENVGCTGLTLGTCQIPETGCP